jgi:hypothetical protein
MGQEASDKNLKKCCGTLAVSIVENIRAQQISL